MSNSVRVPRGDQQYIAWLLQRVGVWAGGQGGPPNIGLTSSQVAALAALASEAQAKLQIAQEARAVARAAKLDKDMAIAASRAMLGGDIEIIDGFAKTTGDEGVYVRAQIDPPKPPTPRTDAPIPTNLIITPTTNGRMRLSFEASKGAGSVFIVQRRHKPIGGEPTAWQLVDTISTKWWMDVNVPSGLEWVRYQVATKLTNGVRSDWSVDRAFFFGAVPEQAAATVQAQQASGGGGGGGGGQSLTIEDAQALKDAQTAKGAMKAS